MSTHQQVGKQRTVSNTSSSSYQKMPVVSASSHSRHSQKKKESASQANQTGKFSAHDHELADLTSSEKRRALEHHQNDRAQYIAKGQAVAGKQQHFSKKNNSITIQRAGHHQNEIVVNQDERVLFEKMNAARNYSATQRQQFIDQQNRVQQDANLNRNALINKSISMNQIQPQHERGLSHDMVNNLYARPALVQYPEQMAPPQGFVAGQAQLAEGGVQPANHMMGTNLQRNGMDARDQAIGITERHIPDQAKSLNLNDSSNLQVEDSLRESIVAQNSKKSQQNHANYGAGRPSGSSKSHAGRSSKIIGTTKPNSSKLTEQSQKAGQSQKNIRKHSGGGDAGSNKAGQAYQSQSQKSKLESQSSKRMSQHHSSLSMSQMLIQKGISNRHASQSSTGFHQKNQQSAVMPSSSAKIEANTTLNQQ